MKIAIISMLVAAALAAEPCCKACDTSAGFAKYYSIDKRHNMCGECCMKPSDYPKYHLFEPGLKAANGTNTPCDDLSYPTYDSTVTHGFGPIKMTLDLYKPSAGAGAEQITTAAGADSTTTANGGCPAETSCYSGSWHGSSPSCGTPGTPTPIEPCTNPQECCTNFEPNEGNACLQGECWCMCTRP